MCCLTVLFLTAQRMSRTTLEGTTASVFNYTANVIQVGDTVPTAGHYSASATFEVMYR
ncbi:fimbrial protein domain-containing protein [Enterobacter cancerogenus]|uniref:Fimbrial protein domain-containing protein n=1 Tax=Enterobacter cancerogenus TaxID=69218 RepID=A0A484WRF2_9ENTR|nr:fimbrial protein domain-containing protein [Enterobacter cancerogenus]